MTAPVSFKTEIARGAFVGAAVNVGVRFFGRSVVLIPTFATLGLGFSSSNPNATLASMIAGAMQGAGAGISVAAEQIVHDAAVGIAAGICIVVAYRIATKLFK